MVQIKDGGSKTENIHKSQELATHCFVRRKLVCIRTVLVTQNYNRQVKKIVKTLTLFMVPLVQKVRAEHRGRINPKTDCDY